MSAWAWILTPLASALIGAITGLLASRKQRSQEQQKQLQALEAGMKILVREKLFELSERELDNDGKKMAAEIHDVYKALGGNHYGDVVYEKIIRS